MPGPRPGGVGPAAAKLDEYIAHRLDREHRLLDALARGLRTHDELLDDVWDDAPAALRPAAQLTLEAHLEKLEGEGRLPDPRTECVVVLAPLRRHRHRLAERLADASAISSSIP